jgi:K+-transporting ATPase KdpF subunit
VKGTVMLLTLLTALVTLFLFIYLVAALLRPEWF